MAKKHAKIFHLKPDMLSPMELMEKLNKKLYDGEFNYVIKESKTAIKRYPREKLFYILQALAYSAIKNNTEALKILKSAEKLFPNDSEIFYNLAKIYFEESEFAVSEEYFLKAIKNVPKSDYRSKAEFLNDLAVLYRILGRYKEAVKLLKQALNENPKDSRVKSNYKLYSKELAKGGPPLDDHGLFQEIQTEEYFRAKTRTEFISEDEAEQVMLIIQDAWNKEVVPHSKKLKNLSITEKSKWFRNIEPDFSLVYLKELKEDDISKLFTNEDFEEAIDRINEELDFLPEDSILIIPIMQPLLDEVGLNIERLGEILNTGKRTDEEEDILLWASDIGLTLIDAAYERDEDEKELIIEEAVEIAADYVPRIKSREILTELVKVFEHIAVLAMEQEKNPRKKR